MKLSLGSHNNRTQLVSCAIDSLVFLAINVHCRSGLHIDLLQILLAVLHNVGAS